MRSRHVDYARVGQRECIFHAESARGARCAQVQGQHDALDPAARFFLSAHHERHRIAGLLDMVLDGSSFEIIAIDCISPRFGKHSPQYTSPERGLHKTP